MMRETVTIVSIDTREAGEVVAILSDGKELHGVTEIWPPIWGERKPEHQEAVHTVTVRNTNAGS